MRQIPAFLVIAALLCCGCGARQAAPVADAVQAQSSAGEAYGLPGIDSLRTASISASLELDGSMANSKSPTAIVDGNALGLASGGNFSSWGVWGFDLSYDFPTKLSVVAQLPEGSRIWIALVDYETGRWEFSGPFPNGTAIDTSSANISPKRRLFCAVLTEGGSSAMVQKLVLTTDNGWRVHELGIPLMSDNLENISSCMVDGRLAIAYVSLDGVLRYLRANSEIVQDSQSWPASGHAVLDGITKLQDISMAVVDGRPCIAVIAGEPDNWTMRFASSTGVEGLPQDWQEYGSSIDNGTNYSPNFCLAEVDGHPAIAYDANSGELLYRRSAGTTGTVAGDWDDVTVIEAIDEPNEHIERPLLRLDRNKPIISYIGHSQELFLRRSDSSTGAKASDWQPRITVGTWQTGDWADYAWFMMDGKLRYIAYDDVFGSNDGDHLHLFFTDSDEKEPGWEGHFVINDIHDSFHISLSAGVMAGMPSACYRSDYGPELSFTFSDPQHPGFMFFWEKQIVNAEQDHGLLLDSDMFEDSDGNPNIIYTAAEPDEQEYYLFHAIRREP